MEKDLIMSGEQIDLFQILIQAKRAEWDDMVPPYQSAVAEFILDSDPHGYAFSKEDHAWAEAHDKR